MSKKVCVVGAGSSGLTAIKACKEENLEVICFEKSGHIGGLWRYHDEDTDGQPSVMKSTIINSSKEMSAFSDFPPPDHYANYMHNKFLFKYFTIYADHFDLHKHINFNHEVLEVKQNEDYANTGKWIVTYMNEGNINSDVFDGVMICTGHHIYPNIPNFKGLENFEGKVVHTHSLKTAKGFENLRVLVIGIGNSAVDAAVELSSVTEKLYLSTRRGSWILPRVGPKGSPTDFIFLRRFLEFCRRWNFFRFTDSVLEYFVNDRFDHAWYNLKPKHRILSAHITVNDALPNCVISGKVTIKQDVDRFVRNGVIFKNEDQVIEIDAVVTATGYDIRFPFIDSAVIKVEDNRLDLYKLVFPPHLRHPTLAFIALTQPIGAMFPIAEAQSRWFAQLVQNKVKLPSEVLMKEEIKSRKKDMQNLYVESPRHTVQVYFISYMDDICTEFGAKPSLWRLALTDPKLFYACLFGPCVPYQYRLFGPHTWSGARDAILNVHQRINAPFDTYKRQ